MLQEEKIIGDVVQVLCDFASKIDLASLSATYICRNIATGARSLLNIRVYSLTWMTMALKAGSKEMPKFLAAETHERRLEVNMTIVLQYPQTDCPGTATCTIKAPGLSGEAFAEVHGKHGHIEVRGRAPLHQSPVLSGRSKRPAIRIDVYFLENRPWVSCMPSQRSEGASPIRLMTRQWMFLLERRRVASGLGRVYSND